MHLEIAALAQKHALSAALIRDLESLLDRRASATTLLDGFVPLDLEAAAAETPSQGLVAQDAAEVDLIGGRYLDLGVIGQGGMGEVRRVRDVPLNRTLAMKTLLPRLVAHPAVVARFLEEAQATAQLQHPGIVPIHEIGSLPDGRLWFTMKEVRGRTLREVIQEVHHSSAERWTPGPSGWSFHRLIASFVQVCNAVGYAHERGVLHRDLKPDNVMLGGHGEVYVLDWGLAKVVGRADRPTSDEGLVTSSRSGSDLTRMGAVVGTPAYMAPEQARGEVDLDIRTDVYALGTILYELLSARPPYEGPPQAVLRSVLAGPPIAVGRSEGSATIGLPVDELPPSAAGPALPEELVAACDRAMAREPADRYPTALALAAVVEAWLDGSKRREHALEVVEQARAAEAEAGALAARAAELSAMSKALLEGVAPWEVEERKAPAWVKAAEADAADQQARLKQLEVDEILQTALRLSTDLPEAHAALATRLLARHSAAEAARDRATLAEVSAVLRYHADALPEHHALRAEVATHLRGDGALTLITDPPGAEVHLVRYVERNRRLVEVLETPLGRTPLREVALPMGSYLALLHHPDRAEVRYPFAVERCGHWDGVAPGERDPTPVWLPPREMLGPDEVYVPAGWFRAGGDEASYTSFPAMRVWCDAFTMHRFPVTNAQYLEFLDDLVARGRADEALRHAPRAESGVDGELGALLYGFDGARFSLRTDPEGDVWQPDCPVMRVDWHGACAYLAWLAGVTQRPWRLPGELEWEKAARGVDGRWYPWGDTFDPSWCRTYRSARGREHGDFGPAVVDAYPVDISPYGVRGLGGNVRDWCIDIADGPPVVDGRVIARTTEEQDLSGASRSIRGGCWNNDARSARSANRGRNGPTDRNSHLGLRGLRPLGPIPR